MENRKDIGETADDHNASAERDRQSARETSPNVWRLVTARDGRAKQLREITKNLAKLKAEGAEINARRGAEFDRVDAMGLDRAELRALCKLLEVDAEKRERKARTRREFLRAHGLPEQAEMFEEPAPPPPAAEGQAAAQDLLDPAVAAALEQQWITEDDITASFLFSQTQEADGEEDGEEDSAQESEEEFDESDQALYERAGFTRVDGDLSGG